MDAQPRVRHLLAGLAFLAASPAFAQQQEDPLEIEKTVVTGSRLAEGDPTARVLTITAEDIAKRGLSTVEDILRTIPQIFSSTNSTNNMNFTSFAAADDRAISFAAGLSSANLRGLGGKNTLVLLNGRRVAGASILGDTGKDFTNNLRNLPVGFIERVEVNLDGGSSVYGSDGIAGVINIITRRDYTGGRTSIRREISNTGAHQSQLSGFYGQGWEDGSLAINLSRTDSNPYSNHRAGYTTRDWSSRFDGNLSYNFNLDRIFLTTLDPVTFELTTQVVFEPREGEARAGQVSVFGPGGPFNLILPEGNDGRNAQPWDFQTVTIGDAADLVELDGGGAQENLSLTLQVDHTFRDTVEVWLDYYHSQADTNVRQSRLRSERYQVPASNAFNNFGRPVWVTYAAHGELASGLIPYPEQVVENSSYRASGGVEVEFTPALTWKVDLLNAKSKSDSRQWTITSRSRGSLADPSLDSRAEELLASPDPSVAINLFGDGTGQTATFAELYGIRGSSSFESEISQVETYLNGQVLNLPGGQIHFAVGGEMRREETEIFNPAEIIDEQAILGLSRPYRDLVAFFTEVAVPVVGSGFELPGIASVVVTASARRDDYTVEGSAANEILGERIVGFSPFGEPIFQPIYGDPILTKAKFGTTTFGLGLKVEFLETFTFRASMDEGFRPPNVFDLFGHQARTFTPTQPVFNPATGQFNFINGVFDPLTGEFVPTAFVYFGPNPELQPEYSDNVSIGIEWQPLFAPGLTVNLDYSEIDYRDRITHSSQLNRLVPPEVYVRLPQIFIRDPDTNLLISERQTSINIARRQSTTYDLEIEWEIPTSRYGWFTASLYYHYVDSLFDQLAPGTEEASFVGTMVGLDKRRIHAALQWTRDRLTLNAFFRYTPGYINNYFLYGGRALREIPETHIGSWSTLDLSGTYRWENGWHARVGGRNVFDKAFPFALNGRDGRPFDTSRVDLRGRVWFAEVGYSFF